MAGVPEGARALGEEIFVSTKYIAVASE